MSNTTASKVKGWAKCAGVTAFAPEGECEAMRMLSAKAWADPFTLDRCTPLAPSPSGRAFLLPPCTSRLSSVG